MLVQEVWKTLSIEGVVVGVSALLGLLVRSTSILPHLFLSLSCCSLVVYGMCNVRRRSAYCCGYIVFCICHLQPLLASSSEI